MKKVILRTFLVLILAGLAYGFYYAWQAVPIISGYSAKAMCSCAMVAGRNPDDIKKEELSFFPMSLSEAEVNFQDSSATSSVFGMATRKAIYRKGLGCTLVVEMDESDLRNQKANLATVPAIKQDSTAWPTGNLNSDSAFANLDMTKINAALDEAFSEPGDKKTRRTRAMLIVYNGKIVAERYVDGFNKDSKLMGWSMSKSITNAQVGVLVKQGKLSLEKPAPVAAWENDDRKRVTLGHLMNANSGLEWTENYGGPSHVTNMLYKKADMGSFAAQSPLEDIPGEKFYYSSGTTNLISRIIRQTVGEDEYFAFPYKEVLYKIGMFNTVLEPDASGTFVGSSYAFGTARDWARFGLLYLNDGVWNGERILPEGWVKYTAKPARGANRGQYGAQWWLNAGAPGNPADRMFPDAPADVFWADGFESQNVFVIPSKNMVIVKLSLSHNSEYLDDNRFLRAVCEAVR